MRVPVSSTCGSGSVISMRSPRLRTLSSLNLPKSTYAFKVASIGMATCRLLSGRLMLNLLPRNEPLIVFSSLCVIILCTRISVVYSREHFFSCVTIIGTVSTASWAGSVFLSEQAKTIKTNANAIKIVLYMLLNVLRMLQR